MEKQDKNKFALLNLGRMMPNDALQISIKKRSSMPKKQFLVSDSTFARASVSIGFEVEVGS